MGIWNPHHGAMAKDTFKTLDTFKTHLRHWNRQDGQASENEFAASPKPTEMLADPIS